MRKPTNDELSTWRSHSLMQALGIDVVGVEGDEVVGRMPVDARTHQIHGQLHGGASAALIETLGSLGGRLSIDNEAVRCVGVEVNANHLRAVRSGYVTGRARALHLGRKTQVWDVRIVDDEQRLVCVGRLTVAVLWPEGASAG